MNKSDSIMKIILILIFLSFTFGKADDLWNSAQGVVSNAEITYLEIDTKGVVYAETNGSIYKSIDGGVNWRKIILNSHSSAKDMICDNEDNLIITTGKGIFILEPESDTARFILGGTNLSKIIAINNKNEIIFYNYRDAIYVLNKAKTELIEINLTKEYHPDLADIHCQYDDNYGVIKIIDFKWRTKERNPLAYHTLDYGKTWQLLEYLPNSNIKFKNLRILDSKYWLYLPENAYNQWQLWDISNKQSIEISEEIINDGRFINYSRDGIYYLRNSKNLYKYSVKDMKWNQYFADSLNLFGNFYVSGFVSDNENNIYVGGTDRRFMKYSEMNESWTDINLETDNINVRVGFKKVDNELYTTDNSKYIFRSINNGQTWSKINLPHKSYFSDFDVNTNGEIIVSGSRSLYYSNDLGENWIEIDTNLVKWYGYPDNIRIFNDGSILLTNENDYLRTRLYLENIESKAVSISQSINSVVQFSDSTHFGINSKRAFIANDDFSEFIFIDSTIEKQYPQYFKIYSFAEASNGSVYLATSNGLYVSPGFIDEWTFVDFPKGITSVSIDNNDYIYLKIPTSMGKDSIVYSDDYANSWKSISSPFAPNFYAFGDGNLIYSNGFIRYGKVPKDEYLTLEATIENDIWLDVDGHTSYKVTDKNNMGVEFASVIIYRPWINKFDTLKTDKNGIAKFTIEKESINSTVNTFRHLDVWAKKDDFQTTNTLSQNIYYNADNKDLILTHINSFYPINFDKHYYLCIVDSTVKYEMVIYDKAGNVIKGKFEVENQLLGVKDSFEQKDDNFASYSFNIPNNTPLGMYKLSFSAQSVSNNEPTSLYETFIIVTDTIPNKYFPLSYEPYPTELITPVDNSIVGLNPILNWYRIQYADSYILQVSKYKSFPYNEMVYDNKLHTTSFELEGLENNTTYYWRVSTQFGYSDYVDNATNPWSFTTSNKTDVESKFKNSILVSPNPFTDRITVSGTIQIIELYDLKGNILYRNSVDRSKTFEYEINTSELPSGTYYIVIDNKSYKVVKTR